MRVQVGPRADFNADEIVDASDLADFEAAHAAADWRADFNDDGVVDELDRTAFAAAMASEIPGSSRSVPNVVGTDAGGRDDSDHERGAGGGDGDATVECDGAGGPT